LSVPELPFMVESRPSQRPRRRWRWAWALAGTILTSLPLTGDAQLVRGTISSAVSGARIPGVVVLLVDSILTTRARALTSDSGTFIIGAGAAGRFHLRIMRIGFSPSESPAFELRRDTTVDLVLADIPVILPALTTRERHDCRLHPDTSDIGLLTFALWEQARTALLAAAITLEQQDYKFFKLIHYRVYDVKEHALRDIALQEIDSRGSSPWVSLPAERLREKGYTTADDSGMTFYAPDLDVLLSPYFTEEHCFRLTALPPATPGTVGIDFEPAARPSHTEIRGTLWLDTASKELRNVNFAFVNLPVSAPDTLLGGHIDFIRLATGAWIIPGWVIRMPTPIRTPVPRGWRAGFGASTGTLRGRWRLNTDVIRIAGGELRAVRRSQSDSGADAVLWRRATGTALITVLNKTTGAEAPASAAIVRLAGSRYAGETDVAGNIRFYYVLPGTYLFEATTALHDLIEAIPTRVAVTVRANEVAEGRIALKPLATAAAEVCDQDGLDRNAGIVAGRVLRDSMPAANVRVTAEWPGGDRSAESREDGYYRMCNIPTRKLVLIRASRGPEMMTTTLTLTKDEIVRRLELEIRP
jgi:hypothetical protein